MEQNQAQFTHNIFKNDPLLFKSYVNKKVTVSTEDGNSQTGIVYTVDPVSESIILIQPDGTTCQMTIIMGHAVTKIELSSDPETNIPELFCPSMENVPATKITERKSEVIKLLNKNRLPFIEEDDVIKIENVLFIKPPYESENIICSNRIVLSRIKTILADAIK